MSTRPGRSPSRSRRLRLAAVPAGAVAVALAAGPVLGQTSDAVAAQPPAARHAASTSFTIGSFNVLGAKHTRRSRHYASGRRRARGVVRLVRRHHLGVVGFQEMEGVQLHRFQHLTHHRFHVYPGFRLLQRDTENSLAWRSRRWRLVSAHTITIPYFEGHRRAMPVVKLRNRRTGGRAWFANFHNPATTPQHRHDRGARRRALKKEVSLARRLHRTGLPVFITGDMNERGKAFCAMTGGAPMRAARGGSHRHGTCHADHPWYVDWIFGSRQLRFSHYHEDASALDHRTTDHPVISSRVRIDPAAFPKAS